MVDNVCYADVILIVASAATCGHVSYGFSGMSLMHTYVLLKSHYLADEPYHLQE